MPHLSDPGTVRLSIFEVLSFNMRIAVINVYSEPPDVPTIEQQEKLWNNTTLRKLEIKVFLWKAELTKTGSSLFGWFKLAVVWETVHEDSARSDYL